MLKSTSSFVMFLLVVLSTNIHAETLYPKSFKLVKGQISDQNIDVLSSLEQNNTQNDWNTYLELSSVEKRSVVKFFFATTAAQQKCQSATLKLNSMGETRVNEKWNFYIKNFVSKKFEKIMTNSKDDWMWYYQEKTINNLSNYINSKGKIQMKSSTNNGSVMDIDFLALELKQCEDTNPPVDDPAKTPFGLDSSYNIQYSATENIVSEPFDIIDIDMEDSTPSQIASFQANGKKVVCYISAGSYENWRQDANSFPSEVLGKNMDGWAGEKWLDISNISLLEPIMASRMDQAKVKGCDAIHPDNIDGYTNNTGFALSYSEQIDYNTMLATLAHQRGMLIALKNDVDQISDLMASFDFVINESCYKYDECSEYSYFVEAKKPVFIIEYDENIFNTNALDAKEIGFNLILKNRSLDAFVKVI